MNIKLVGVVSFLLTNLMVVASTEETVAQRIARKSKENRITEALHVFNYTCEQELKDNQLSDVDYYEYVRINACYGRGALRSYFGSIHTRLPREQDRLALEQAQKDVAAIAF